jgi:hypothetical protein
MSPLELAIIVIGFLGEFAALAFIAFQVRQTNLIVQHVADLQAAVLSRTDRTDKTVFRHHDDASEVRVSTASTL